MSEDSKDDATLNVQDENPPPPLSGNDWFLEELVARANENGDGVSITLIMGGFLVSGSLMGGKEYFEALGQEMADSAKDFVDEPEHAEFYGKSFSQFADIYDEIDGDDEDKKPRPAPSFIHLSNARFYVPGGNPIPGNKGVLWRGRLAQVSGFNIGILVAEKT